MEHRCAAWSANEAPPIPRTLARVAAEDAIVAEALEKRYGPVRALAGVTFSVRAGEVFGLLGPNGAGKSTTVRVLTTLTRPDAGRALVAGYDVVRAANRVRRSIGYVPQESGVVSVVSTRTVVDLPAPFGPSRPKTSPSCTENVTPSSACTSP